MNVAKKKAFRPVLRLSRGNSLPLLLVGTATLERLDVVEP
jgi:hypothetical protein